MCTSECPTLPQNTAVSHCGACHETFSTVRNFDRHRVNFECVDPATKGLIQGMDGRWREAPPNEAILRA
jgi:hypothetical protein